MDYTLMVLAAGIGSRYGGLKQLEGVGPGGETLMDYGVFDAVRVGFNRLVFVTRPDIETAVRARFERLSGVTSIATVNQRLDDLPPRFAVPPQREKPWGTAHAMLVSEAAVSTPFAVINADDFYGAAAYRLLREHFDRQATGGPAEAAMVAYTLRETLSPHGNVARGVCRAGADGYVAQVTEVKQVTSEAGQITGVDEDGEPWVMTGDEPASMNFWGFTPAIFHLLRAEFVTFLEKKAGDLNAEFYISNTINALIRRGAVRLKMYRTVDRWFGMTSRGDRAEVVAHIRRLVDAGVYPERLFG